MCVIAGYIGHQQAAPILLDMLKREEGFAGAYYTGIATVHNGQLHYAKVVGDAATLERETSARNLPGTIGIAHGRPKSGGGREWAHPFIDRHNRLAYIANGAGGKYETDLNPATAELVQAGVTFQSEQAETVGQYRTRLPNGSAVHGSETIAHLVSRALDQAENQQDTHALRDALMHVFDQWPEEIVALCLHADQPDQIAVARHNYPMVIGRDADNCVYVASMGLAFPKQVNWRMRMAPHSGATLHRHGGIDIKPLAKPIYPVAELPSPTAVEQRIVTALRQTPNGLKADALMELSKPLWQTDGLIQKEILIYELIESLLAEGRVTVETRYEPGAIETQAIPQFYVRWQYGRQPSDQPSTTNADKPNTLPTGITIAPGSEADYPAITRFIPRAFGIMTMSKLSEDYFGKQLGELSWQERINQNVLNGLKQDNTHWIVARIDQQVVGFASYWFEPDRELAVVGYNAVDPDYQGRGIGSALQREVICRIQQAGYEQWQVTTLAHDYPAQRVYEKLGFDEVARSITYLRKPGNA